MLKAHFESSTIGVKILLFLAIVFLSTLIGYLVLFFVSGGDPSVFLDAMSVQWIGSFFTNIIPPFILAYLFSQSPKKFLYLDKGFSGRTLLSALLLYAFSYPAISFLTECNQAIRLPESMAGLETQLRQMQEATKLAMNELMNIEGIAQLIMMLLLISVLTGIGEELLFRGTIQRIILDRFKNTHWAVWVTAAIFGAIHLQFYELVPLVLMGVLLGYLLVWSGSIYLPMVIHALNNAIYVVITYLANNKIIDPKTMDPVGTDSIPFRCAAVVSVIATVLWIIYLKKHPITNSSDTDSVSA